MMKNFSLIFLLILLTGCNTLYKNNFIQPTHYDNVSYEYEQKIYGGISMAPTFFQGNTVLLKKYNNEEIKEGQIVCFSAKENVCHRVISVYKNKIVTGADNTNLLYDINQSEIKYLVVGVLFT